MCHPDEEVLEEKIQLGRVPPEAGDVGGHGVELQRLYAALQAADDRARLVPAERGSKNEEAAVDMSRHEHGQSFLKGSNGGGMATAGAVSASPETRRATREVPATRDRQCDLLFTAQGLLLAFVAARFSPLANCLLLLLAVAQGREVGEDP